LKRAADYILLLTTGHYDVITIKTAIDLFIRITSGIICSSRKGQFLPALIFAEWFYLPQYNNWKSVSASITIAEENLTAFATAF